MNRCISKGLNFNLTQSIFDDDLKMPIRHWNPILKTKTHSFPKELNQRPLLCHNFEMENLATQKKQRGLFCLFERHIAIAEEGSSLELLSYMSINFASISKSTKKDGKFFFTVMKSSIIYEFTTEDNVAIETWLDALTKYCVRSDFHQIYTVLKEIGKGSFAAVHLAQHKTSHVNYAVKCFRKDYLLLKNKERTKAGLMAEITILRDLTHDNISQLHGVFETEHYIYLVQQLIKGETLQDKLEKNLKLEEIHYKNIMSNLIHTLSYLASKGVMHRDLNPHNIIIDENDHVTIIDFGLATYIDEKEYLYSICGTPGYIAPEVFNYDTAIDSTKFDNRCDIFSLGAIFYYMMFGKPLFPGKNKSEIMEINKNFTVNHPPLRLSLKESHHKFTPALDLLLQMLEADPTARISAAGAFQHPYLNPEAAQVALLSDRDIDQMRLLKFIPIDDVDSIVETVTSLQGSIDGSIRGLELSPAAKRVHSKKSFSALETNILRPWNMIIADSKVRASAKSTRKYPFYTPKNEGRRKDAFSSISRNNTTNSCNYFREDEVDEAEIAEEDCASEAYVIPVERYLTMPNENKLSKTVRIK
jgi:serine/threonine protein kinase